MRRAVWLVLAAVAWTGAAPAARADGMMTVRVEDLGSRTQAQAVADGLVSSNGQRALFVQQEDGGCWDLFVEPGHFTTPGAAWILPVPVAPSEVAEASEGLLDQLAAATRPLLVETTRYHVEYCEPRAYAMCGGGSGGGGTDRGGSTVADDTGTPAAEDEVTTWGQGRVGPLDWEVLSALESGALETWLGTHGYAVPDGLGERAAPYVEAGWYFVATRLARGATDPTGVLTLRFRLCLERPADSPVYPLRLTTLSMGERLDLLLWVADRSGRAPSRLDDGPLLPPEPRSYASASWGDYSYEGLDGAPPDFAALYEATLADALARPDRAVCQFGQALTPDDVLRRVDAAARAGLHEPLGRDAAQWAPELRALVDGGLVVTRWRARLAPATMEEDLTLTVGGFDQAPVPGVHERTIRRTLTPGEARELGLDPEDPDASGPGTDAALLLLVLAGNRLLRRRGPRARGGAAGR